MNAFCLNYTGKLTILVLTSVCINTTFERELMRRITRFAVAMVAVFALVACQRSTADEITFFGDFADGFGAGPSYSSFDPPDPGSFTLDFSELIVGIPKFDPSLGTLTDITVFVEDTDPIFYFLGG